MSDSEHDRHDRESGEERPRIKVTDRRMFDREGNLREDAEEQGSAESPAAPAETPIVGETEPAAAEPRAAATSRPEPDSPGGSRDSTPSSSSSSAGSPQAADDRVSEERLQAAMDADRGERAPSDLDPSGQSPDSLPRDFPAFIESQYYEALLFLGAMRHPATGETVEDLDMARYKIDLLSMLRDKTDGNRTAEESQLLDDVLYQLRMGYLQKRKVVRL